MPLPLLQLLKKFVVLDGGEFHILLWKNVPKVNIVLVAELGDLGDKAGGVPYELHPLWLTGTRPSLLGDHLQKNRTSNIIMNNKWHR